MTMTVRYTLFWTEVKERKIVKTHSVELDVEAHTLVFEVLEAALKALRLLIGQRASQTLLQHPASNWELRFCKGDGYPLFDIPCSFLFNGSYRLRSEVKQSSQLQHSLSCVCNPFLL